MSIQPCSSLSSRSREVRFYSSHLDLSSLLYLIQQQPHAEKSLKNRNIICQHSREELYYYVWVAHGCPDVEKYGEHTLDKDAAQLFLIKEPYLHTRGAHLLEQWLTCLEEGRVENFQKRFMLLYENPRISHRQLSACYERAPHAMRPHLPKPPFFGRGVNPSLYKTLGAHCENKGTRFRVFAPHAKHVAIAIKYDSHDQQRLPMTEKEGVWEVFGEGVSKGTTYELIITSQEGKEFRKVDPFAFGVREYQHPIFHHEAVVCAIDAFAWTDSTWLQARSREGPLNIYEVHPTSWKKHTSYRTLAVDLAHYCGAMGYTHVEFMALLSHPVEESWGYQVSNYFAPNHRLGPPEDFQYLVNYLHQQGIGVILDWVPAHFSTDSFGLSQFDGSFLFEANDKLHPQWKTLAFDVSKKEVRDFLVSSAFYWIDKMHVDGIRVDSIVSLQNGKRFLQDLNFLVHQHYPGVHMIAEDSASSPLTTTPLEQDGLGFDFKWSFNWLHCTLHYFKQECHHRRYHHNALTHAVQGDDMSKSILSLSHDEIGHGKKSLIGKMPNQSDPWQKFAHARLFFSFQLCLPGKKLTFMGSEFAQSEEWSHRLMQGLDLAWHELQNPYQLGLQRMVKTANHLYRSTPALFSADFHWVDHRDESNAVISYRRRHLLCLHNFTAAFFKEYIIYFLHPCRLSYVNEIFNSDAMEFGGSGQRGYPTTLIKNQSGLTYALKISLAPLATQIFNLNA